MSDPDPAHIHPVACESCRAKKCKCDRVLPRCGSCSKSRTRCTYPQSFRRGFPEGYLAGLEQRLLQTEIALFKTLAQQSQTYTGDASASWDLNDKADNDDVVETAFREHAAKQTKPERPQEWTDVPLRTREQRRRWFEMKAEQLQLQTGFRFDHSARQQSQRLPMSMPARSSSTLTTHSDATATVASPHLTTRSSFSSTQWSSPPVLRTHTHIHDHATDPIGSVAGSSAQWIPQLLQGTGTGTDTTEHGTVPATEHPDTMMSSSQARQMSLQSPSSSSPGAVAGATTWRQQLVPDNNNNDVDMAAAEQPRISQASSAHDGGEYLSKAQALSARQARRFF